MALMFDYLRTSLTMRLKSERGQALVEYALILALVSIAAIGALELLGTNINSKLNFVAGKI